LKQVASGGRKKFVRNARKKDYLKGGDFQTVGEVPPRFINRGGGYLKENCPTKPGEIEKN